MNEHRLIEQVLACLEQMADRCATAGELDPQLARDAVWFLRTFADRCHHGKEEAQLFPMMESRGFSTDAGPTAVMRVEHNEGRDLVGRIEQAIEGAAGGDRHAVESFVHSSRAFVELLRAHIEKEDHCLFPMADQALSHDERDTLRKLFEKVDDHEIGQDAIEKCHRMANDMADRLGVPRARLQSETTPVDATDGEKAP
jgi:hemerythrin-like domain-containing protein